MSGFAGAEKKGLNAAFAAAMLFVCAWMVGLAPAAQAEPARQDQVDIGQTTKAPVYMWSDSEVKPRAAALLIHGLTLHGAVYDQLARHLASQGVIVFAPDLRGYGRWQHKDVQTSTGTRGEVHYNKSFGDVKELAEAIKHKYPNLPLFCMGESLGADVALHVAASSDDLIDGLVLSAPAIKRRSFIGPMFNEALSVMANPQREINLGPYIKKFFSEDPRIANETDNDPLVRKKLSVWDLLSTCRQISPALKYADRLSADTPVLIIQGDDDRMLQANAISRLVAHLKTSDTTVRWFNNRGHLLLETGYMQPDTVQSIDGWLSNHMGVTATAQQPYAHNVSIDTMAVRGQLQSQVQAPEQNRNELRAQN